MHLLGLPRSVIVRLFNEYQQTTRLPGHGDELRRIFGAEPYTFFDGEVAALREFGALSTSKRRRANIRWSLRPELKAIVDEEQRAYPHPFGYYKSDDDCVFKFEEHDQVTVKYKYSSERGALIEGDTVLMEHTDIKGYKVYMVVDELLSGKSRTVLMRCTILSVDDPRKR